MNKHLYLIDVDIKSRDLKTIIQRIKPLRHKNISIYHIREHGRRYIVVALGEQEIKYRFRRQRDYLSGLSYRILEADIHHMEKLFMRIYWSKTYYRVRIMYNPLTIKILCENPADILGDDLDGE